MSAKPHLNLIVMGHVDHGKSTLTGHLLFDAGYIDQKTIEQYAKESEKTGAGDTFKYAWVLDTIRRANSKSPSDLAVKRESTLTLQEPSESRTWSSPSTKWTTRQSSIPRNDTKNAGKNSKDCSRL